MIRFLLIVLIFALPAQSVWAAVAGYCAHERDPVSFHIGHHTHEHRAASDDVDRTEAAKSPAVQAHTDCSYCHAVVAPLASSQPSASVTSPRHIFQSTDPNSLGTAVEDSIERPKWIRAR